METRRLYRNVLFGTLVWGTLAFGAPYPWAFWPLAAACVLLGVWGIASSGIWRQWPPSPLVAILTIIGLGMLVPTIPLPYSLFARLSPNGDRFFLNYELGYDLHRPASHALALDPTWALIALALFAAFAVFLIGLTQAYRYMRLEWLVTRLIGFGVVLAVFGAIQKSFNYKDHYALVYGFWEPSGGRLGGGANPFGPFLNRNHFAGWMVLVLPIAIAYACAILETSRRPRGSDVGRWLRWLASPDASRFLLAIACVLAMGASLFLTGSRSGIAAFGIAALTIGVFLAKRLGGKRGGAAAMAFIAVLVVGALAWAGIDATVQRFSLAGEDAGARIAVWKDALRIFRDFPIFGVGFGSFGLSMLVYQSGARDAIYFQSHNDYLQVLAEGGLLVAIPAFIAIVLIAARIRRRLVEGHDDVMTYWIRAGAIAGIVGMAAQSAVEFSLQMPGITALFVALLALAMHRQPDELTRYSQLAQPRRSGGSI